MRKPLGPVPRNQLRQDVVRTANYGEVVWSSRITKQLSCFQMVDVPTLRASEVARTDIRQRPLSCLKFPKDLEQPLTDRVPYPSTSSRASYRADSLAGTTGRCGVVGVPWARTAAAGETSAPAAASNFP